MVLLRRVLGDTLRERRLVQHRTLRDVSTEAKVSLGYLSELERGQKEASSELLSSICEALGVQLSDVLREVSDTLALAEEMAGVLQPVGAGDGGELATAAESEPAPVPSGTVTDSVGSVPLHPRATATLTRPVRATSRSRGEVRKEVVFAA